MYVYKGRRAEARDAADEPQDRLDLRMAVFLLVLVVVVVVIVVVVVVVVVAVVVLSLFILFT